MIRINFIPLLIIGLLISGCGTESDPGLIEWNGSWKTMGLEGSYINAVDASGDYLFAAGREQVSRHPLPAAVFDWKDAGPEVDTEISEVSDILVTEHGFYTVLRTFPGSSNVPLDFKTLFVSSDHGNTWHNIEINNMERQVRPHVIIELAECCDNILYALSGFLYKSEDDGKNWNTLDHGGAPRFVYVSEEHQNQIWIGGQTNILSAYLEVSKDYGETWESLGQKVAGGFSESTVYSVVVNPVDEEMILVGIGGGIRKSEDSGESWETVQEGYAILNLANSRTFSERVYGSGLSSEGKLFIAVSEDYGHSWQIELYPNSPDEIYVNDMVVTTIETEEVVYMGTNRGVYGFRLQ